MTAPDRIWIDWKRANDGFLAYDERPNEPFSDCRDAYIRADLAEAAIAAIATARENALREARDVCHNANGGRPSDDHLECARAILGLIGEGTK